MLKGTSHVINNRVKPDYPLISQVSEPNESLEFV